MVNNALWVMVDFMGCARALNSNYAWIKYFTEADDKIEDFLVVGWLVVLIFKLLQSDNKIKTLPDTAELIEYAVSAKKFEAKHFKHGPVDSWCKNLHLQMRKTKGQRCKSKFCWQFAAADGTRQWFWFIQLNPLN